MTDFLVFTIAPAVGITSGETPIPVRGADYFEVQRGVLVFYKSGPKIEGQHFTTDTQVMAINKHEWVMVVASELQEIRRADL